MRIRDSTRIVFKGDVSNIGTSTPLVFARLDGKGANFGSLVETFSNHKPSLSLKKPFTISASVEASAEKVDISRVEIVVRNSKITGGITVRRTETPQINAAFHSASLDFDELFSGVANVPSRDTSDQRQVKQQETALAVSADTDLPRVGQVAIPSNIVQKIINDIKNFGEVKRAFIGIQILEVNDEIKKYYSLNETSGVLITKIIDGGAASKTEMREKDIIVSIDGEKIETIANLHEQISKYRPGDNILCEISRNGKILSFELELEN